MNRDLEDKMQIMKTKSIEAAEKVQSVFHAFGAINLLVALYVAIKTYTSIKDPVEEVQSTTMINIIAIVLIGVVACLVLYYIGDYLYYSLSIKAYNLEFLYNNSCCIADVNKNMVEGMSIIHSNQNKILLQDEKKS